VSSTFSVSSYTGGVTIGPSSTLLSFSIRFGSSSNISSPLSTGLLVVSSTFSTVGSLFSTNDTGGGVSTTSSVVSFGSLLESTMSSVLPFGSLIVSSISSIGGVFLVLSFVPKMSSGSSGSSKISSSVLTFLTS